MRQNTSRDWSLVFFRVYRQIKLRNRTKQNKKTKTKKQNKKKQTRNKTKQNKTKQNKQNKTNKQINKQAKTMYFVKTKPLSAG